MTWGCFCKKATGTNPARIPPEDKTWPQIVALRKYGKISQKPFSHYRPVDVDTVLRVGSCHVLLTLDWPLDPPHIRFTLAHRPEKDVVERLRPQFHFVGHHHRSAAIRMGNTEIRALNIIARDNQDWPNTGWVWIGIWEAGVVTEVGFWPSSNSRLI